MINFTASLLVDYLNCFKITPMKLDDILILILMNPKQILIKFLGLPKCLAVASSTKTNQSINTLMNGDCKTVSFSGNTRGQA